MPAIFEVLVVEDNPADVRLIREAFQLIEPQCNLTIMPDGEQALAAVRQRSYDLVILDLLLPGADGLDVIRTMKSSPQLKAIVIIVLTGIRSQATIQQAYGLGANCCLTKPYDFDSLTSLLSSTVTFWTLIAHPVRKDPGVESGARSSRLAQAGA